MREEPENRLLLYTVMFARAFGILCCFCLISYYIPVLPGNIVFKDAPWLCRGGGIAASPLFQQADVGKTPATTVKHYTANMTNASQIGLLQVMRPCLKHFCILRVRTLNCAFCAFFPTMRRQHTAVSSPVKCPPVLLSFRWSRTARMRAPLLQLGHGCC